MHCGKKWWIREFVPPYIFPLNPDYVAARSLRSLRSNKVICRMATSRLDQVNNWHVQFYGFFLLKISFDNFQNPLGESGLDNLKRSRPALTALILVEFCTRSGNWFQYLITLLLEKSCADLNGWEEVTLRLRAHCLRYWEHQRDQCVIRLKCLQVYSADVDVGFHVFLFAQVFCVLFWLRNLCQCHFHRAGAKRLGSSVPGSIQYRNIT